MFFRFSVRSCVLKPSEKAFNYCGGKGGEAYGPVYSRNRSHSPPARTLLFHPRRSGRRNAYCVSMFHVLTSSTRFWSPTASGSLLQSNILRLSCPERQLPPRLYCLLLPPAPPISA